MEKDNVKDNAVEIPGAEPFASEMYRDLKKQSDRKDIVIKWLCIIIALLALATGAMGIYHIYMWSKFDTVYVGSTGEGHANYINGDNTGGVYNGIRDSEAPEEGKG